MRGYFGLLFVLGACAPAATGANGTPPPVNLPQAPDTNDPEHELTTETRSASCAVDPPKIEERSFGSVIVLGTLMGKSWAIAQRSLDGGREPVLVHLDRRGRLLETPLPGFTEDVAFEPPHTVHFLEYAPRVRWWSVDVSAPDAPKVSTAAPGPALGFDSSSRVKAFAVSDNRALISVYRVKYGGPKTLYLGETALYDRTSAARIGNLHPFTTWRAQCGRFGCVGYASNEKDDSAELATVDARAAKRRPLGASECAGVAQWRDGAHWLLVRATASSFRVTSVDLTSGEQRELSAPALIGCRTLSEASLGGRKGVIIERKEFVPISKEPRILASEPLPELLGRSLELAPLPDGALLVDFSADSWMKHGPTDSRGMRRYHREWSFGGRAGLLRLANRGWKLEAIARLPGDGSEGMVYGELDANVVSHQNHAAVIVDGSGKSQVALLSRPCD